MGGVRPRQSRLIEELGRDGPVDRWRAVRDEIHDEVLEQGYDGELGSFVQSYGVAPARREPAHDPARRLPAAGRSARPRHRSRRSSGSSSSTASCSAITPTIRERAERRRPAARRGRVLPCSFWLVDTSSCRASSTRRGEMFERLLALRNDLGLLSEEYDPKLRRLVGNFPQAFSHLGARRHRVEARARAQRRRLAPSPSTSETCFNGTCPSQRFSRRFLQPPSGRTCLGTVPGRVSKGHVRRGGSVGSAVAEVVRARQRRADVALRDPARERAEGLELADEDVPVAPDPLEAAAHEQERLAAHDRAVALVDLRRTIRFTWPSSSSSSMKTIPFAVDGRWRAIARPAKATRLRCGASCSSSLESVPGGRCGRRSVERVRADGEARVRGSRRASAPRRSARGSVGVAAVGSSGSASCFASPRVPGSAARKTSPSSQSRSRRRGPKRRRRRPGRAPPARRARDGARRARSATSANGPFASRSATSASASSSPTDCTYASPIRTATSVPRGSPATQPRRAQVDVGRAAPPPRAAGRRGRGVAGG